MPVSTISAETLKREMIAAGYEFDMVRISAADFNGKDFDGAPFSPPADWMIEAVQSGVVKIGTPGHTDYACFGIKGEYGEIIWAGPGDYLIRHKGRIVVLFDHHWQILKQLTQVKDFQTLNT